MSKSYNILFIVCHPDDEALWMGGLIYELSKVAFFRVYVICLSGADNNSPRIKEFYQVKSLGNYYKGVVLGGKLGSATTPLPEIVTSVEDGLKKLELRQNDIDVLITHSPYGDEHQSPHHIQAYREILKWTRENQVPFGFFSCIPIPFFNLKPQLKNMKRKGTLQLLNFAKCFHELPFFSRVIHNNSRSFLKCPAYYLQFLVDIYVKSKMINTYKSVGLKDFEKNYATFSSNCESIYLFDDNGLKPFLKLFSQMEIPGSQNLFNIFHCLFKKTWLYFINRLSTILKYALYLKAKN